MLRFEYHDKKVSFTEPYSIMHLSTRIVMIEYQLPRGIMKYSKCLSYLPSQSIQVK